MRGEGYPSHQEVGISRTMGKGKTRLSTKQCLVILLAGPLSQGLNPLRHPFCKDLQAGLRSYFGINRSIWHIYRLLSQLRQEGVIRKEIISLCSLPGLPPIQCRWFKVVDFSRGFEDLFSLVGGLRKARAREKRRRRYWEAKARVGRSCL